MSEKERSSADLKKEIKALKSEITELKQELKLNIERDKKAQQLGKVGNWEYNLKTSNFWGSEETKRICGFDLQGKSFSLQDVEKCFLQKEILTQALSDLIDNNKKFDLDFEIISYDKKIRKKLHAVAILEKDKTGEPWKVVGVLKDITLQKQIDERLQTEKQRLKSANKLAKLGYWDWFADSNELICSDEVYVIFGRNSKTFTLTANSLEKAIHPEDLPEFIHLREKAQKQDKNFDIEFRILLPDDSIRYVHAIAVINRNENDEIVSVNGIIQDVTEKKMIEIALQNSEERFRDITENAAEWIWEVDTKGKYTYVSPNVKEILGFSQQEMLQKHFYDLILPEEQQKVKQSVFATIFKKMIPFKKTIFSCCHKDGSVIWLLSSGVPLLNDDGSLAGFRGGDLDVSERIKAEMLLKKSEAKYRSIFDNAIMGIFQTTKEGKYLDANRALAQIFGYNSVQELKTEIHNIADVYVDKFERENWQKKLAEKKTLKNIELEVYHKSGKKIWISMNVKQVTADDGSQFYEGTAEDITNQKKWKHNLAESKKMLNDIFASIQDGMSILDTDLNIIQVNQTMQNWYKKNLPLEGKKCYLCYHDYETPCDPCPSLRCLKSGKTEVDIVPGLPGSPIKWIELFSYPIRDPETNDITGIVEFVRDITTKQSAILALKESEDKYRNLFEKSTDPSLIIAEDKFIDCNETTVDFLKYESKKEIIGKFPWQLSPVYQPDGESSMKKAKRLLEVVYKNGYNRFEWVHLNSIGEEIWVDVALTMIQEKGEKKIFTVWRDINEKKIAQNKLAEFHNKITILVKERTLELEEKNALLSKQNADLEKFNRLFVKREFRIKQLREKIKKLEEKMFGTNKPEIDEGYKDE